MPLFLASLVILVGPLQVHAMDGGVAPDAGWTPPPTIRVEVDRNVVTKRELVVFEGNVLFQDTLYRSLLHLPEGTRATREEARAVAITLRGFLRRAGYDLATVHTLVEGDQIRVQVDEGQLDKMVIIGQGFADTVRFKLGLSLPENVFNRPALEERLRQMGKRQKLLSYTYELTPVETRDSYSPELDELGPLLGLPGIRPGHRYELHILLASDPWSRGFSPELALGSLEGLGLGGRYRGDNLWMPDDRWEVSSRLGAAVRQYLDSSSSRPILTHARLEGRWFSAPIIQKVRPAVTLRADLWQLQRPDLHLENFDLASFSSSVDANVSLLPELAVLAGGGIERRFLFDIRKALNASPVIDKAPTAQTRPYLELVADAIFNPNELRSDRRHRLEANARYYPGSTNSGDSLWLRAGYQKRVAFGWNELVLQAHGTLLNGEVLFMDEESIGSHLHGPFGNSEFVTREASAGTEFRYAMVRDIFKVGLYYDQVFYGSLDRLTNTRTLGFASGVGIGLHLLIADEFQADLYFGLGVKTGGNIDVAPALAIEQVF